MSEKKSLNSLVRELSPSIFNEFISNLREIWEKHPHEKSHSLKIEIGLRLIERDKDKKEVCRKSCKFLALIE